MSGFANEIKRRRLELNYSLREAAKKIGMSHAYLDKLEKGYDARTGTANKPTPETVKLISEAYRMNYDYLLEQCGYLEKDSNLDSRISNPDIRLIARAGKKMTGEQAEQLRRYAEYMFPEAFKDE